MMHKKNKNTFDNHHNNNYNYTHYNNNNNHFYNHQSYNYNNNYKSTTTPVTHFDSKSINLSTSAARNGCSSA